MKVKDNNVYFTAFNTEYERDQHYYMDMDTYDVYIQDHTFQWVWVINFKNDRHRLTKSLNIVDSAMRIAKLSKYQSGK